MSSHQHDDKQLNKLLRIAIITCVLSAAAIATIFCGGIRENLSRDSVTTPPTTTPVVSTYVVTTNPHIVVSPPPTEGISPVPGPTSDTPVDSWCHQWSDPESRIVILCLGDSITYGNGSHESLPLSGCEGTCNAAAAGAISYSPISSYSQCRPWQ